MTSTPVIVNCPSCNRPNAEGRTQCLYCGKELPAAKDVTLRANPKVVKRVGVPTFHLVLLPGNSEAGYEDRALAGGILDSLKEKFSIDRYQWGQLLKGRAIRMLRTYKERGEADQAAQFMQGLGLGAIVVANEEINAFGYSFRAQKADFSGEQWIFRNEEHETMHFLPSSVFFLARGRITVNRNATVTERMGSKGAETVPGEDSSDYEVLDLFSREAGVPAVRVRSSAFDFTCLGEKVGASSLLNFNQLVALFMDRTPGLKLDEKFRFVTPILTDDKTAGLFDPTIDHISGAKFYQNNERQFSQYARMACLLFRDGKLK